MPCDSVVNNLAVANVTAREVYFPQNQIYLPRIRFGPSVHSQNIDCYFDSVQFVMLNYIESTLVGVCCETAPDNNGVSLPILRADKIASWRKPTHKIETDITLGHTLHFIDLHPQRRFVTVSLEASQLLEDSENSVA